ncbi:MAG: glycosyltransferase family 2 protein [Pseudomonadota bacterium]
MGYTLVATAKNEGPYLFEWVAYHRMIGFDTILIFQNDSDDGTDKTLRLMHEMGLVHYRYNRAMPGRHQVKAYITASRNAAFQRSDWAIALDLDEFLRIRVGRGHLDDLMGALPEADEVLLNWRRFGDAGHDRLTRDLVTTRFTRAEPADNIARGLTAYKALFKPRIFGRPGIHRPKEPCVPEDQIRTCNGSGLFEPDFTRGGFRATDPGLRRLAQVNHYMVRDAASFVMKSKRGSGHQADREISHRYWTRRNFNDVDDFGLAARQAEIWAAMDAFDRESGGRLSRLRAKSIKLHQARFRDLLEEPFYRALYAFCRDRQESRAA